MAMLSSSPKFAFAVFTSALTSGEGVAYCESANWRLRLVPPVEAVNGLERTSLGVRLQYARDFADAEGLLAAMIVVLVIGIALDAFLFARIEHAIRAHRGLIEHQT